MSGFEFITENISYLETVYKEFTNFTKLNPVVGGMIGLWAMGVLTYLVKDVPKKIISLADRYLTVSVTLDSGHESFHNLIAWYEKNKDITKNRTMRVTNGRYGWNETQISLGLGSHYFMYNMWGFVLTRSKLESSGSEKQKEEISIKTIGLNQKRLLSLIKSTIPETTEDKNYINLLVDKQWERREEIPHRPIESVILKEGQKERILDFIKDFEDSKDWYNKMGVSYKTGIIFSGPPGTGKTSIIKALANHLKKDLCVLSCGSLSDTTFMSAISSVPKNSIVLMEDFDSISATKSRDVKKDSPNMMDDFEMMSLSGLLNAIDGVFSSDGRLLIATTNKIDDLDEALLRPGRFDLNEVIDYADSDMATRLYRKFFPDTTENVVVEDGISLAQVENCCLINKRDSKKALESIKKLKPKVLTTPKLYVKTNSSNSPKLEESSTSQTIGQ